MLVPAELFDEKHAAELLAANGMPPAADECAVCCGREEEYAAVAAINREILRQIEEKLGDRARFTTPLLHTPHDATKTVWMCRRAELSIYKGIRRRGPATGRGDSRRVGCRPRLLLRAAERLFPAYRNSNCASRATPPRRPEDCWENVSNTRHANSQRKIRGRAINPPKNLRARPTTDFAKENLFNVLGNLVDFEECDVFDLFAGTGSISYEFASRGVHSVTSVEINPVHYNFIKQTAADLGIDNLFAVKANVFLYLKSCAKQFDLIFSDAPYDLEGSEEVVRLVLERDLLNRMGSHFRTFEKNGFFGPTLDFWQLRSYGSVQFSFFKKS